MAGELAGTPELAVAQNLQIDNSAAARASAIAHAQKIRNLFPDIDAGAQPAPPVIPELGIDPDPGGDCDISADRPDNNREKRVLSEPRD